MPPTTLRTAQAEREADGVIVVRIAGDVDQSLDDARDNLAAAIDACGGQKRPLLIDITAARPLLPEVRRYYSGNALVESFHAFALLIDRRPVGRIMGNIYLRIARPGIPTRLFDDEAEARRWLRAFLTGDA